jgi:protein transport protein SEC23
MLMNETAQVGLITYGKNVHIHELAFEECPKSFVLRGDKDVTTSGISTFLGSYLLLIMYLYRFFLPHRFPPGLKPSTKQIQQAQQSDRKIGAARFIMAAKDCEMQLRAILEDLTKDNWFALFSLLFLREPLF